MALEPAPMCLPFVSAPIDTPPALGSLEDNQLCGVDWEGKGTYTADGITKLCEALKGSAVTTLECAHAQRVLAFPLPTGRGGPSSAVADPPWLVEG